MHESNESASDLLAVWISNDSPVYRVAVELDKKNREKGLDYGSGLRSLISDIRLNPFAYREMRRSLRSHPNYARTGGYPVNDDSVKWTMRNISDQDFQAVDWTVLSDDLFSEVNASVE